MKPKTVGRVGGINPTDTPYEISGLQSDSYILTLEGEKPVSELCVGDRVITRDSGVACITSVRSRKITAPAVRISAGSLGHTRPERDVLLPAGQPVLIRDWRAKAVFSSLGATMVEAYRLIDGEFVTDEGNKEMTLYVLDFDRPHILYADGLEVASDAAAYLQAQAAHAA
ncbi:MAG: Hint domain-containing protein [Roseovarius sp.]